jgi:hypothetical protein
VIQWATHITHPAPAIGPSENGITVLIVGKLLTYRDRYCR